MSKIRINVYTNMDSIKETNCVNAIKDSNIVKYINNSNKFTIDLLHNILVKENNESVIKIDFNNNCIVLFVKELQKEFKKDISTLEIINEQNSYYVKYKLIDEEIINEYKIKFL